MCHGSYLTPSCKPLLPTGQERHRREAEDLRREMLSTVSDKERTIRQEAEEKERRFREAMQRKLEEADRLLSMRDSCNVSLVSEGAHVPPPSHHQQHQYHHLAHVPLPSPTQHSALSPMPLSPPRPLGIADKANDYQREREQREWDREREREREHEQREHREREAAQLVLSAQLGQQLQEKEQELAAAADALQAAQSAQAAVRGACEAAQRQVADLRLAATQRERAAAALKDEVSALTAQLQESEDRAHRRGVETNLELTALQERFEAAESQTTRREERWRAECDSLLADVAQARDRLARAEASLQESEVCRRAAEARFEVRQRAAEAAAEDHVDAASARVRALTDACKDAVRDRKQWARAAYQLAMVAVALCANAVTVPAIELTEYMRAHRDLMDRLVPTASPADIVEFLRINNLRGNVMVNKNELELLLQTSKQVIERSKKDRLLIEG